MHGHYFFLIGGVGIAGLVVFPPCTDTRSCVEDFCGFELFELISLGDQFWLVLQALFLCLFVHKAADRCFFLVSLVLYNPWLNELKYKLM